MEETLQSMARTWHCWSLPSRPMLIGPREIENMWKVGWNTELCIIFDVTGLGCSLVQSLHSIWSHLVTWQFWIMSVMRDAMLFSCFLALKSQNERIITFSNLTYSPRAPISPRRWVSATIDWSNFWGVSRISYFQVKTNDKRLCFCDWQLRASFGAYTILYLQMWNNMRCVWTRLWFGVWGRKEKYLL